MNNNTNTTLELPEGSKATISGKNIDGKNYLVVEVEPETLQIEDLGTIGNCAGCLVEIYMNRCGNFRNDKNMILCPLCYIKYLVLKGIEMYFTDIEKLKQ